MTPLTFDRVYKVVDADNLEIFLQQFHNAVGADVAALTIVLQVSPVSKLLTRRPQLQGQSSLSRPSPAAAESETGERILTDVDQEHRHNKCIYTVNTEVAQLRS